MNRVFRLDQETSALLERYEPRPVDRDGTPGAAAQRSLALRLYERGQHAEAEACLRAAYAAARREGNAELAATTTIDLAHSVRHRSPAEALGLLRRLPAAPGARGARIHNLFGTILLELCAFALADRHFRRGVEAADREGDERWAAYVLANRAGNRFEMGDRSRAEGLHRSALERLEALGDAAASGLVARNMAAHRAVEGRYEEALGLLERGRRYALGADNVRLAALLDLTEAELELVTGDRGEAAERFASAARRAGVAALPGVQATGLVWKAIVEGGAAIDLAGGIEDAARDLHARDLRYDAAALYLIGGALAQRNGRSGERLWTTGSAIFAAEDTAGALGAHFVRLIAAAEPRRRGRRRDALPRFLTLSPAIVAAKERLRRLADTEVRILIEGESGTGKSFLARLVHEAGRRRSAPFVVVDCTNLEENLFESKLFGHVRGAFTGAVSDSVGLVEQANGGTLFLDEVGEMPVEIQAKLLYTVEEQRFRPVGARAEKRSRFRVIAATNRDVDAMVDGGGLRRDLFFRLAGFRVRLPAIRDRREDVVPLVDHRLARLNERYGKRKTLRPAAWRALVRHDWPGNVRELNAALERGFHLADGRRIGLDDLGLDLSPERLDEDDISWYAVRRSHLLRVLRMCRGNVTRAARLLGLNRTTLIYKLKLLDIERADFDPAFDTPAEGEPAVRLVADRQSGED